MNAFYLLFSLFSIASAQVLEQVGDVFPIVFRSNGSSDVKGTATPLGKSYVLSHPGATYISLRFSKLNLLTGDSIEVTDASGGQGYTLTGSGKGKGAAFWSQHIKGDTVVLNTIITSKSWKRSSIFTIDKYAAGFESLTETICGNDDKVNAACYASSFPTEYSKSKAVARLLINGNSLCTGFLVSGSNHLLTNNHCIASASDALNTDFEFMGEAPSCDSSNWQLAYRGNIFGGATLIKTSVDLDYSLVQINSGNPSSLYGFLELDDQPAAVGGRIYIPQYAGGKAKQMAIFSSQSADAIDGFCRVNGVGNSGCGGTAGNNLFYFCDTEGGSSGSPVVSRTTNRVLGLHKCGGCTGGNHATSAYLIRNQISTSLPPLTALVPAPTAPIPAPVAPPVPASTAPIPAPVAPPVPAPTAPIPAPVAPPVPAPTAPIPAPVAPPVPAPTAPIPASVAPPVPASTAPIPAPVDPPVPAPTAPIPAPVAPPVPAPTAPIPAPVAPPVPAPTVPKPSPVAAPVRAPTAPKPSPVAAPVRAPTAPKPSPVAAPVRAPTAPKPSPVAAPVKATPTAPVRAPTTPVCLRSNATCSSNSRCCSGVCKFNRRCK